MNVVMGKIENKKTERESRTRSVDNGMRRSKTENLGRHSSESGADCTSVWIWIVMDGYGVSVRVDVKTMLMLLGA